MEQYMESHTEGDIKKEKREKTYEKGHRGIHVKEYREGQTKRHAERY